MTAERTAIVVLGAAVWPTGPSPTLIRRARHAAEVYHAGGGECLIACGGLGEHPPTEAEAIKSLLVEDGVPTKAIWLEAASTTTYENLRNAAVILKRLGIRRVVIVTDTYHGPRAVIVARALGLEARAATPSSRDVALGLRLERALRETAALPVYAVRLPFWIWRDR